VTGPRLAVTWAPRPEPLIARAVAATGDAALALGHRLAAQGDAGLARLAAVAGDGILVALASSPHDLPWCDGVVYLGSEPAAPTLLMPTALAPSLPAALLERAVRARLAAAGPIAVLPAPLRLVACGAARAIDRGRLAAWLGVAPPEIAA
jgi:hypothetical protein